MNENVGWICPKCGMAVSPNEKTCPNCKENRDNNNLASNEQIILS